MIKIVFFGTPAWTVSFFEKLLSDPDSQIVGVVTQPDKPIGREQKKVSSLIKKKAQENGIPVFPFPTLKTPEAVDSLRDLGADLFVVVAYGKIIPPAVLALPPLGCLNVHPSLLPKYRGASPIISAIAEGETETGISLMLLDEGMDTGPVLASLPVSIAERETAATLTEKISRLGPLFFLETLKKYASGSLKFVPQDPSQATFTKQLERNDGRIDWTQPCAVVDRRMRAFDPWPGSWTIWNRKGKPVRLKILEAVPTDLSCSGLPGTITIQGHRCFVNCADRKLELFLVQIEGKVRMNIEDFLRGYGEFQDSVLL
ncbi:MAG TPA: methionyl-tRNA formyltransferase [Patescibacteria group bacterium]|nr:methionyl-tRNA formyltransferase [Patescibacteria group bacterium]